MDRLLYMSMLAARNTMQAQSINSHNLANVNTAGFKADLAQFTSMPLQGEGYNSRVFAMQESAGVSFKPGVMQQTGHNLDVAINGDGMISVLLNNGTEAYTRAGDLRISSSGMLETGAGFPVLGNGGPIVIPPAENIEIGGDGTVTIRPVGQDERTLATVNRIKLVNPPIEDLVKTPEGLFQLRDLGSAAPDASVRVTSGILETSNVNMVESLVSMINLARQFEMNIKAIQTVKENDERAAQMLRLS